jgi:DNA-binding beta-propeller fold protein YncE
MKLIATVITPGNDHEYIAIDPASGQVYQNIPDLDEYVIIDPVRLRVVKTVKTPELKDNHPLQFDAVTSTVVVGGKNGKLSVYDTKGTRLGTGGMPPGTDQCDLDPQAGMLACAADGTISLISVAARSAPKVMAEKQVGGGAHTLAIDPKTHSIWTVLVTPRGDFTQQLFIKP